MTSHKHKVKGLYELMGETPQDEYHLAMFDGQWSIANGGIKYSICLVT